MIKNCFFYGNFMQAWPQSPLMSSDYVTEINVIFYLLSILDIKKRPHTFQLKQKYRYRYYICRYIRSYILLLVSFCNFQQHFLTYFLVTVITLNTGKKILLMDGYMFKLDIYLKNGTRWTCIQRRHYKCGVVVHLNTNYKVILVGNSHNHVPILSPLFKKIIL